MPIYKLMKSIPPLLVFAGIAAYGILSALHKPLLANFIVLASTFAGSFQLFRDTFSALLKKQYGLDYIAMLAIISSIVAKEYLVGSIIALMIASGRTLEEYGTSRAKKSLTELANRIPSRLTLFENGVPDRKESIEKIQKGWEIFIKKGEAVGLDGILASKDGLLNEASMTGEPYPVEKIRGDKITSGTINEGSPIVVRVSEEAETSTYKKIIAMVEKAQKEKAPLVRLAEKYSVAFTAITLLIAFFAYLISKDFRLVLAVLVIATPCPLILATPIALMGGMNAAAKQRIIAKKLASFEVLSRANAIVFDKTGTITIGKPAVVSFKNESSDFSNTEILSIAEALERNSLHPLAGAIVNFAKENKAHPLEAEHIEEKIGSGISGIVQGKKYTLAKLKTEQGMAVALSESSKQIAVFLCEDQIKESAKSIALKLKAMGLELFIFTGDKQKEAEKIAKYFGVGARVRSEMSPEDKQNAVRELKRLKHVTAMVGDGINDAPAMAIADVGMVFSNEERTAASEAADIVFLGGDFSLVLKTLQIARKTVRIALQSIAWGIGASVVGMLLASFGLIPPIAGAIIQEGIDVAVILNALRAAR